jgi:hypothetical protein
MSRLDFFIARLTAQRALLDEAARLLAGTPGCVFEVGLGSGRTYDHMRALFPDREIFAFDRALAAHPMCIPDGDHMILGEIRETLRFCQPRIPGKPAFIHVDLGSGDATQDLITRSWLSPLLAEWVEPGALILTDRPIDGGYTVVAESDSAHRLLQVPRQGSGTAPSSAE